MLPGAISDPAEPLKTPPAPAPLPPDVEPPLDGKLEAELQRISKKVDACLSEILSLKATGLRPSGLDVRMPPTRLPGLTSQKQEGFGSGRFSSWPSQAESHGHGNSRATAFNSEASGQSNTLSHSYISTDSGGEVPRSTVMDVHPPVAEGPNEGDQAFRRRIAVQARDVDLQVAWRLQAQKMSEHAGIVETAMQPMFRLLERTWMETIWEFLDDPSSSLFAWWTWLFLKVLVMVSFLMSCSQTAESPSRIDPVMSAIWEMALDILFFSEFLGRVISTPSKKIYFKDCLNWADIASALALPLRISIGLVITEATSSYQEGVYLILQVFIPLIRFLKLLRYFEAFRLLVDAFKNSVEALPVLAYLMALITVLGAAAIYISEERDNIPSFQHAMWLSIITMTSVGYGDYVPHSFPGYVSVSILTFVAILFLALPVGIIGYEFTSCWRNRWKVLLIQKARKCLEKWGYTARDVRVLFDYVDVDGDGSLNLSEFIELIRQMRVGINAETSFNIFSLFDDDQNGSLDCTEFLRHVFPEEYVKDQQEKQTPVRKSRAVVSMALQHLENSAPSS